MATTLGTLLLLIKGDTKDLKSKLTEADKSILSFAKNMTRMGNQLRSTGKQLTAELTLPLVGLAVAALKTAGSLDEFKAPLDQMRGSLRGAMADILRGALPVLQSLAKRVSEVAAWFTGLSDGAKKTLLVLAGIAAAVGPSLVIVGRLVTVVATLQRAFVAAKLASLAFNATMLANPIMLVVAAVGLLATGLVILRERQQSVKREMQEILDLSKEQAEVDRAAGRRIITDKIAEYTRKLAEANAELERSKSLGQFAGPGMIARTAAEVSRIKNVLNELSKAINDYDQESGKLATTQSSLTETQKTLADAMTRLNAEFVEIDRKAEIYGSDLDVLAEKKRVLRNVIDELVSKGFTAQGDGIRNILALYGWLLQAEQAQDEAVEKNTDTLVAFATRIDPLAKAATAQAAFFGAAWVDALADVGEETETLLSKLQRLGNFGSTVFNMLADIISLTFSNREQALENEEAARRAAIESSITDEEARAAALAELDTEFEERRRELAYEEAKRSRNVAVFQSILDTANAVMSALATVKPTVPLGVVAAILVGALGAAKTALIAATPLPALAEGGSFIVPPGYPNDSFPMRVESGEQVEVTPADQMRSGGPVVERPLILNFDGKPFYQGLLRATQDRIALVSGGAVV